MTPAEAMEAVDWAFGYAMMRALFREEMETVPAPVLARALGVRWACA
jgi:hypothetical protein